MKGIQTLLRKPTYDAIDEAITLLREDVQGPEGDSNSRLLLIRLLDAVKGVHFRPEPTWAGRCCCRPDDSGTCDYCLSGAGLA